MKRISAFIITAVIIITPFLFDRNAIVVGARGGINLNTGNYIVISNNLFSNGTQIGSLNPPPNLQPVYQQVAEQVAALRAYTQKLYSNFGK